MPSGLLLFCTFLFSTFRYENAKQLYVSINQSINQFYFLLSATSSMPLALYNGTHTF